MAHQNDILSDGRQQHNVKAEKSKRKKPQVTKVLRQARQDDSIMGTNDSSIVSKRSVMRLYYPNEPDFYAPFVTRFQRRNPLINRGYWLRMQAVEQVVRRFIHQASQRQETAVVVNLGCGYDPLPFQILHGLPQDQHVHFVDVDYPQLMGRKVDSILRDPRIQEVLGTCESKQHQQGQQDSKVVLQSTRYTAVACDLRDLQGLDQRLADLGFSKHSLLFVAEVSITYMATSHADALIAWASKFEKGHFCLLEQYLPDTKDHPFASTMLKHFNKLSTPIHAINQYPLLEDQRSRFLSRGWSHASIQNLWHFWGQDDIVSAKQRRELDAVEPFDEWEEFALFAGHYFLLVASMKPAPPTSLSPSSSLYTSSVPPTGGHQEALIRDYLDLMPLPSGTPSNGAREAKNEMPLSTLSPMQVELRSAVDETASGEPRRFGAGFQLNKEIFAFHGGSGIQSRQTTTQLFSKLGAQEADHLSEASSVLATERAYACHSITSIPGLGHLLVGGRESPSRVNGECFALTGGEKGPKTWSKVANLSPARFRHSAVQITVEKPLGCGRVPGVLVFGGKTEKGDVLDEWRFWDQESGWQDVRAISGDNDSSTLSYPCGRFGAAITSLQGQETDSSGILMGGMTGDGRVLEDAWAWTLTCHSEKGLQICCQKYICQQDNNAQRLDWSRFGASLIWLPSLQAVLAIGGISATGVVCGTEEVLALEIAPAPRDTGAGELRLSINKVLMVRDVPRPLFVGFSAAAVGEGEILVCGGGGVCFSMGSFWNPVALTMQVGLVGSSGKSLDLGQPQPQHLDNQSKTLKTGGSQPHGWSLFQTPGSMNSSHSPASVSKKPKAAKDQRKKGKKHHKDKKDVQGKKIPQVRRIRISSPAEFEDLVKSSQPAVIEGLDIGPCVELWTPHYLREQIGAEREVIVHASTEDRMTFQTKNFSYLKQTFGELLDAVVDRGEKLYLRSVASKQPAKQSTKLSQDFPSIAADFRLPPALQAIIEPNLHSSPLRISGPVQLWLHYDVLANVLCQIRGHKHLRLFPPSDVAHLGFPPGGSSSNLDPADAALMRKTHAQDARLNPGDVLFLPPMWAHSAAPTLSPLPSTQGDMGNGTVSGASSGGSRDDRPNTSPMSVAVNVFWRNLSPDSYALGKDVYGNRDLAVYEGGRKSVEAIKKAFGAASGVPDELRMFYLTRLVDELREGWGGEGGGGGGGGRDEGVGNGNSKS